MTQFRFFYFYSNGDNRVREEGELTTFLEDGWEIISSVADKHKVIYILRK